MLKRPALELPRIPDLGDGPIQSRVAFRSESAEHAAARRVAGMAASTLRQHAYQFHEESTGQLHAHADAAFAYLDGHARLAAHMARRSWRTLWGRMAVSVDANQSRSLGSRIRLEGKVLGLDLAVEETVVERVPPTRKTWETVGIPRLLVMGRYRMGFVLTPVWPTRELLRLTVAIDYDLPETGLSHSLGMLVGRWYARWCTSQLVADARMAFLR